MDKVQKIRKEVERLRNELIQEKEKDYGSDVDDACILELQNILTYIDSLQEEPVIVDAPPYDYVKGFSDGRLYEKRQKEVLVSDDLKKAAEVIKGGLTMSKAEKFAYSKYPKDRKGVLYDLARNSIIQGYHQAEKDLELSWEDIPEIFRISEELKISWWFRDNEQTKLIGTQVFWEEVLKRFKEKR